MRRPGRRPDFGLACTRRMASLTRYISLRRFGVPPRGTLADRTVAFDLRGDIAESAVSAAQDSGSLSFLCEAHHPPSCARDC